jgi:RNA polymerase sigma-70 factor (ECF subfamily)
METDLPENTDALDRADMARLVGGHDAALNDLMARHAPRLFHYLLRQLHNESDAEDAAQESFVRVFQHRDKFDPRHRFSTWLFTIATHLARDRQRQRQRHPAVSLETENEPGTGELKDRVPSVAPGPDEQMVSGERAETIRRAVALLPEDLREPLILAEYEELSHAEIGQILACSPKAVEMRVYRARQQLRLALAQLL